MSMLLLVVAFRWCTPGEVFFNFPTNATFAINCTTNGDLQELFDKAYARFPFLKDSIIEKKYNETVSQNISTEVVFTVDDVIRREYSLYVMSANKVSVVLNLRSGNTTIDNNFNINRVLDYHLVLFTMVSNGLCNTKGQVCIFQESVFDPTVGYMYKGVQMSYSEESIYTHVSNRYAPTCIFANNIGQWKHPQDIDNFMLSQINLSLGEVSPTEVYLGVNDTFRHYDSDKYNLDDMVYMYNRYGMINSSKINCNALFNNFICSKVPVSKKQLVTSSSAAQTNFFYHYLLLAVSLLTTLAITGHITYNSDRCKVDIDVNKQAIPV